MELHIKETSKISKQKLSYFEELNSQPMNMSVYCTRNHCLSQNKTYTTYFSMFIENGFQGNLGGNGIFSSYLSTFWGKSCEFSVKYTTGNDDCAGSAAVDVYSNLCNTDCGATQSEFSSCMLLLWPNRFVFAQGIQDSCWHFC